MKKIIAMLLALVMVFGLVACGNTVDQPTGDPTPGTNTNSPAPGGAETPETPEEPIINFDEDPYEVSIQFVGLFEQNTNIANVEAALNAITLEKINVTVDIVPVFIGALPTTTSLGVAGDEKLDIVVAGLTSAMSAMVADELLLPLDELLAERGQAALAVTANVAEAQKIDGVTYGITGYPYAATAGGFYYNKDMAAKYGINMYDGMTLEELTAAGEILKQNGVYLTAFGNSTELNYKFLLGGDHFGSSGEYGSLLDPANSTTIENVYASQQMHDYWTTVKQWNDLGYLPDEQLTDTTRIQEYFQGQFVFGSSGTYNAGQVASQSSSNFEVGMVMLTTPVIATGGVTEFMLGIAANCERPDKAMDLINLIYSDAEVANLLQYGVEGTDYVAVEGTENVITRAGSANEDGNSYSSSFVHYGDPMKVKVMSPLTDSYYADMAALEAQAEKSMAFGYAFDATEFSTESAAISSVLSQMLPALNAGEVDDVDQAIAKLVAALEAAGINDIIAANQEQLNAYLGK